jgi:hypothetical protein
MAFRVQGRTAANGRTTLNVDPGSYLLSAQFPGCETKDVPVEFGETVSVRLDCALP